MYSHRVYIVATTKRVRDVVIDNVYDAEMFTRDTIIAGIEKQLKGMNYDITKYGDNAYIDLISEDGEMLVKTISIVAKNIMLKKGDN